MAIHLQGVKDKIMVKEIQEDQVTEGGIIMPETATQRTPQLTCVVISVGKEVSDEIQKGMTILCHPNAGMAILVDKEIYKVLRAEEIYCTVSQDVEGE